MNKRGIFLIVLLIVSFLSPIGLVDADCLPMPPRFNDPCHGPGGSCRPLMGDAFESCMTTCLAKHEANLADREAVRQCLAKEAAEKEKETASEASDLDKFRECSGGCLKEGFAGSPENAACNNACSAKYLGDSGVGLRGAIADEYPAAETKIQEIKGGVLEIEELGLKCTGVKDGGTVTYSGSEVTGINAVFGAGGGCTIGGQSVKNLPDGSRLRIEDGKLVIKKTKSGESEEKEPGTIKEQMTKALEDGDLETALALVKANQLVSDELELSPAGKLRLAGVYAALGRQYESLSEYNNLIEEADALIKNSDDSKEIDRVRKLKADALFNLGRNNEAKEEYKKLSESEDKNVAATGKLNLALLKSQGDQKDRGEAMYDFENLEKLAKEINDPALEKLAHRLSRNMKLELREEYLKKGFDGDENAAVIAKRLTEELELETGEIDTILNSYEKGFGELYGGEIPENLRKELDDYALYLKTLSKNPRYASMTKSELEKVKRAAVNLEIEEETPQFKKLYDEQTVGINDHLAKKRIENELMKDVPQVQALQELLNNAREQKNVALANGDESTAKAKEFQILRYDAELAKWKKAITGNEEYDLDVLNGDILDEMARNAELAKDVPWYGEIPLLGPLISEEASMKKGSDNMIANMQEKWEEDRVSIDLKAGNIAMTRYNPNSGEDETVAGTVAGQWGREATEYKEYFEEILDASIQAEIMLASMYAANQAFARSRAAAVSSSISEGATTVRGIGTLEEILTASEGTIAYKGSKATIEGTAFHFTNEAGQVLAGKKNIDEINWNPSNAILTFTILGEVGALEELAVSRTPLMKTTGGKVVNALLINPSVQAAGMTLGSLPSIALSDAPPEDKLEHLKESYVEGFKFALAMNVVHMPAMLESAGKAKAYEPYQKEITESQMEIERLSKDVVGTKGEKGFLGDPINYVDGKITPEAKLTPEARQKLLDVDIEINKQQKKINEVQERANRELPEKLTKNEWDPVNKVAEWFGMKENPQKVLNKVDSFKINAEKEAITYKEKLLREMKKDPVATERELLLKSKELRDAAQISLDAKENYVKSLESNSKTLALNNQFSKETFTELKDQVKAEKSKIDSLDEGNTILDRAQSIIKEAQSKLAEKISKSSPKAQAAFEAKELDRQGKYEEAIKVLEKAGKKITLPEELPAPELAKEREASWEKVQERVSTETEAIDRAAEEVAKAARESTCA